jgi:hypothetical protein
MTNKSRTIFRSVRLFGSGRDARTRGRFQRVVSGDATASPNVSFALRRGAFCVPADWPNQILQRVSIPDGRAGYRPRQHCNYGSKKPDRCHDAAIRVYDEAGNVIETHEHVGDFKEP